ncbi:unnamed protein product [Heligmosomoides polygyrus]|uniref:BAG domain-containing protein n=1 Tax=Heligmosomoides polygyrus TaxID=6339 RepID=A0A183G9P0_HELPZ|nr:unnamed protein product [Heligmosomoides polygyrus]
MAGNGNDVTSAEFEKLLLEEVTILDHLLAERNATLMRSAVKVMLDQLERLEDVPSPRSGKGHKTAKVAASFVKSLSDIVLDKCSIMRDELQKLKQVERREHAMRTALSDKISPLIHKLCIQVGVTECIAARENPAIIEQLNAHEYEGAVYHAEFDPIGAESTGGEQCKQTFDLNSSLQKGAHRHG